MTTLELSEWDGMGGILVPETVLREAGVQVGDRVSVVVEAPGLITFDFRGKGPEERIGAREADGGDAGSPEE